MSGHLEQQQLWCFLQRIEVYATLPFDRLVDTVAKLHEDGVISERIVLQTGVGGRRPEGIEVFETLPFDEVQALLRDASIVICHGGTGSLITALREGCHVIAIPRLHELGEHYDDHQLEITEAFAQRGLARSARSVADVEAALKAARTGARVMATTDSRALISYLDEIVESRLARAVPSRAKLRSTTG